MQSTLREGKRIGIITGSGPEAGIDLWQKILQANRRLLGNVFRGDLDAPRVTVFSEPMLGLSMELAKNDPQVWAALRKTAASIAAHVDYYAIACNTLNYYQPQLDAMQLPARLVSFADVIREHLASKGIQRVALLGARSVIELGPWSPYRCLAEQVAIEIPKPDDAACLHQLIYDVKCKGGDSAGIRERFRALLDRLESDAVLLACTELPLIPIEAANKQLIDVTNLVAEKMARLAAAQCV